MQLAVSKDSLSVYLREIEAFPLLRKDEEFDLAVRYREHNDLDAARRLVCSNLRFVVKIAREYAFTGAKIHDLIQEGNIGLMMAVKKFDPYRGIRLLSYAIHWIRAYMNNFIMKSWSLVKIGTTEAQRALFSKLRGRLSSGDAGTIAETLNMKESEVESMQGRLSAHDVSLHASIRTDKEEIGLDFIKDSAPDQEEILSSFRETEVIRKRVHSALDKLPEKESFIVKHRIMSDEPMTLQEIGDKFGISRERARQIEASTLKKLKGFMEEGAR